MRTRATCLRTTSRVLPNKTSSIQNFTSWIESFWILIYWFVDVHFWGAFAEEIWTVLSIHLYSTPSQGLGALGGGVRRIRLWRAMSYQPLVQWKGCIWGSIFEKGDGCPSEFQNHCRYGTFENIVDGVKNKQKNIVHVYEGPYLKERDHQNQIKK